MWFCGWGCVFEGWLGVYMICMYWWGEMGCLGRVGVLKGCEWIGGRGGGRKSTPLYDIRCIQFMSS